MNSITHHELVRTLAKAGVLILAQLTPERTDMWHAATGIAGECGELLEGVTAHTRENEFVDLENVIEELGDIEFYMEQLRQNTGIKRSEVSDVIASEMRVGSLFVAEHAISVTIYGSQILDIVKKCAVYNAELKRDELEDQMNRLDIALAAIRLSYDLQREVVLKANIEKLMKRYEGLKYSDKAAEVRADKEPEVPVRKFFAGEPV